MAVTVITAELVGFTLRETIDCIKIKQPPPTSHTYADLIAQTLGYYDIETAQAIFLIAFPMSIVGALSLSTARLIETEQPDGAKLVKRLHRHRLWTQFIGMSSIIATVFYWTFRYLAATPGF